MRMSTRCDRFAPGVVREALAGLPQADQGWVLGDAMLVASELVSNAVRHSGSAEDQIVSVDVRRAADRLEISVSDPGESGGRAELSDRPMESGGLGLKVVDQLSARWGSERRGGGYRVWAELPLPA